MLNRVIQVSREFGNAYSKAIAGSKTNNPATRPFVIFIKDTASGFITTTRSMVTILGITAIAVLTITSIRPEIPQYLATLADSKVAHPAATTAVITSVPVAAVIFDATAGSRHADSSVAVATKGATSSHHDLFHPRQTRTTEATQQQALVTKWLAKRYRVAGDATDMLVSAAYTTAKDIKLDPLLILSVMAIESRFNPFAESPVGAQGLMQVMSTIHKDKFQSHGGVKAALNPVANIKVGSLILKDYVTRGGSIEAGLKLYVGAAAFETDFGYGSKVLAEYQRLKQVANGKSVPLITPALTAKIKPAERPLSPPAVAPVQATPNQTPSDVAEPIPVATVPGNVLSSSAKDLAVL